MAWCASGRSGGEVRVAAAAEPVAPSPIEAPAFDYARAQHLADRLGLQRVTAVALVRRGIDDVETARRFLEGEELPPPGALTGVEAVAERLLAAREAGHKITVFGDFDVDGVCGTAIMVEALRRLGADCDWMIPDRMSEGYGLNRAAVERLAARGTRTLVTVDCGITAVEEVAAAKRAGLDVMVTDHHRPGDELPDCLIVHPGLGSYACPNICGAAVAWKLATALGEAAGVDAAGEEALDLVALATVADLVPLDGESRTLVRRGLAVARRAARPGLRALIQAAGCGAADLDESDLGFRLAPRINAAGRLYRADAGVELLLTRDEKRAAEIAEELNRANQERRDVELRVLGEAESAVRRLRDDGGELPVGLVAAGEGWHPGVIGIVASRLVELHRRPALVVSLDGRGGARGSGRGVNGFDLLAALRRCEDLLGRFGGHRAAAGFELEAERVEALTERFAEAAAEQLDEVPVPLVHRIDAFAAGPELGLELAEELERLGPFGIGNPAVNLLVPSAGIAEPRPMGKEEKHLRFTVLSAGFRARAVAFSRTTLPCADEPARTDLVMRLERNQWNGGIEPRLVLREVVPLAADGHAPVYSPRCPGDEWCERFEAALAAASAVAEAADGAPGASVTNPDAGQAAATLDRGARIVHRPGTGLAALAELIASGARVLAVCADAGRRAELALGSAGLGRFAAGSVAVCSPRDGRDRARDAMNAAFVLTDYRSLMLWGEELGADACDRPGYVVLVDPPAGVEESAAVRRAAGEAVPVHHVWDERSREFALGVLAGEVDLRPRLAALYRLLREAGEMTLAELRERLATDDQLPPDPESIALQVGVLTELELIATEADAAAQAGICARRLRAVSSDRTDLERSRLYNDRKRQYEVKAQFLRNYR